MKKTMYVAFTVFIVIISVLELYQYSAFCNNFYLYGTENIKIVKKHNQNNKEFIEELKQITADLKTDIFYLSSRYDITGSSYTIYKTNNNDNLYNIDVEGKTQILKNNECLTTKSSVEGYNSRKIYGVWTDNNYTIFNFDLAENKNLNDSVYYVKSEYTERVLEVLTEKGYNAQWIDNNVYASTFDLATYLKFALIPFIVLVMCFIFYFLLNGKATMLKRLDGFSEHDIRIEEWSKNIKVFLGIFIVTQLIHYLSVSIFFTKLSSFYFKGSIFNIIVAFIIAVVIFVICSYIICLQKGQEYIKGKSHNKLLFAVLLILKTIFSLFVLVNLSTSIIFASYNHNVEKRYKEQAETTKNYAQFTLTSEAGDVFSDEGYSITTERCKNLYNNTVDKLNGVIIYAENYGNIGLSDTTVAEMTSMSHITVNENYLLFNPLYGTNGKLITKNDFKQGKYNFLVSDKYGQSIPEIVYLLCDEENSTNIANDINIVYYKADQNINTMTAEIGVNSDGKIDNPVIEIYDINRDEYGNILSYVAGHYFIKTVTDDSYNELLPYIKEVELDNVITDISLVSTSYLASQDIFKELSITYMVQALLYFIGLVILTVFSIKNYFLIFKNHISVKKMSGFSLASIHKIYFMLLSGLNIIVLSCGLFEKYINMGAFNLSVFVCMIILDIVSFIMIALTYTRKNILEILKGN
ncbi:MAG: hypothetical protein U0O22_03910 [Acutalibacteraceae bacterium]